MRTCRVMFSGASRGMVYLSDTRSPIMRGSQITSQLEVSKIYLQQSIFQQSLGSHPALLWFFLMYSRAQSGLQVVSYFESSLADDDVIIFLIGRCDNFGFGFLILSLKLFYFLAYLCSRVKKNKPCVFRDKVYTSPPLLHRNFLDPPLLMWSLNLKQTRGTQQNFTTWYE